MLGEMCTAQKCTAATIGARTQGMNGRSAVQEHLGHFGDESFQSVTLHCATLHCDRVPWWRRG